MIVSCVSQHLMLHSKQVYFCLKISLSLSLINSNLLQLEDRDFYIQKITSGQTSTEQGQCSLESNRYSGETEMPATMGVSEC